MQDCLNKIEAKIQVFMSKNMVHILKPTNSSLSHCDHDNLFRRWLDGCLKRIREKEQTLLAGLRL